MKKIKVVFLVLSLLTVAIPGYSAVATTADTFTSGRDWSQKMSFNEKLMSLLKPFLLLHRYGVPIDKTAIEYVEKIDKVILENPYLADEEVSNIFASTVYTYEPQTRPTLDALELEFLKMKVTDSDVLRPKLIVLPRNTQEQPEF